MIKKKKSIYIEVNTGQEWFSCEICLQKIIEGINPEIEKIKKAIIYLVKYRIFSFESSASKLNNLLIGSCPANWLHGKARISKSVPFKQSS